MVVKGVLAMKARNISALIFSILMLLRFVPGYAGTTQPMQPSAQQTQVEPNADRLEVPRVTLHLQDATVQQAVDELFKGSGREYQLDPRASGMVTVNIDNVPFDTALRILANTAGLTVRHVYVLNVDFQLQPPTATFSPEMERVSEQRNMLTTRTAPGLSANINTASEGIPGRARQESGVSIQPVPSVRAGEKRFDITLDQANLVEAIKQLMEMEGRNYVLDLGAAPNWTGVAVPRISARIRNASLDQILDVLARSTGLIVTRNGTAYTFRLSQSQYPPANIGATQNSSPRANHTFRCPKCGQELIQGWRWCPSCGSQLSSSPKGQ